MLRSCVPYLHEIATDLKILTSGRICGVHSDAPHCRTAYHKCYQRASGVVIGDGHVSWHILRRKLMLKESKIANEIDLAAVFSVLT